MSDLMYENAWYDIIPRFEGGWNIQQYIHYIIVIKDQKKKKNHR